MISSNNQNNRNNNSNNKWQYKRVISAISRRNKPLENAISENKERSTEQNNRTKVNTRETPIRWTDKGVAYGTVILALATIFLTAATFYLYREAVKQRDTANQMHFSDSVFADRRFKNDSILAYKRFQSETATINKQIGNAEEMYALNKASFDSSNVNNKKTFHQQIASLNETKEEFEKENRAVLFVPQIKLMNFKIGVNTGFNIIVKNIGNQPVYCDSIRILFIIDDSIEGSSLYAANVMLDTIKTDMRPTNFYLEKSQFANQFYEYTNSLSPYDYDVIKQEKEYFFCGGRYTYVNLITGKRGAYEFYAMLWPAAVNPIWQDTYTLFYNKNE